MAELKASTYTAMTAVDTAGGIAAIANPEGARLIITRILLDVQTPSTGACSVSAGVAANATTLSANLIDTQSVAAAGVLDNYTDKGTNGRSRQAWGPTQYVTVSTASGASAGLVGNVYVQYIRPS